MKFFLLVLKNIARNRLRSSLTAVGTMMTVFVVTLVWSILAFLDMVTEEKSRNLKAIVTERWRVPSLMPFSYASSLAEGAARRPSDVRPMDSMTWQFYGGTLTPGKPSRENILFAVAMEPSKIMTMLDELDNLPSDKAADLAQSVRRLELNRQGIILGFDRLTAINRQVGDRFKVYSINFKEIDLEFEIVGMFPRGRYDNSAIMNRDYLNQAIDAFGKRPGKQPHPMAGKCLNLVWLRVSNRDEFDQVAAQIAQSPYYSNPAVKCETASSMISSALEAFRDLIWAMRYLLSPAALVTLSMIIANAISISVRERRLELAVLKVLGFRPRQIMFLVLAEALLIGTLAGLTSAALTYVIVNQVMGGLKFPLAFFGAFFIPGQAIGWGAGMGATTALVGSIVPAWSARNVRVAEVFAKIA